MKKAERQGDTMKKRTKTLIAVVCVLLVPIIAYAASRLIISTERQKIIIGPEEFVEITPSTFFPEKADMKPGDSLSINPTLTNDGSVYMYMFMRVEMPMYDTSGLFEINNGDDWELIKGEIDPNDPSQWIEVYRYNQTLPPDQTTIALADKMTLKKISNYEFANMPDLEVAMTGYGCAVSEATEDTAWGEIENYFGL